MSPKWEERIVPGMNGNLNLNLLHKVTCILYALRSLPGMTIQALSFYLSKEFIQCQFMHGYLEGGHFLLDFGNILPHVKFVNVLVILVFNNKWL